MFYRLDYKSQRFEIWITCKPEDFVVLLDLLQVSEPVATESDLSSLVISNFYYIS